MSEKWTKGKHTPGPWKVSDKFCDVRIVPADYDQHVTIATMGNWQPKFVEEQRANARLIASAPDMAEALRELLAIVKTRHGIDPDYGGMEQCPCELADIYRKAEAALRGALGER